MRSPRAPLALALALLAWGSDASADAPPRDWFLNPPPAGNFVTADLSTGGPQIGVERRRSIADEAGMTVLRGSALAGIGFGEAALLADARFLFFTVGATAGYRQVWRTYAPDRSVAVTRDYRLELDSQKAQLSRGWPFGEGRLRLALPMESSVLVINNAVRHEGAPDNSYDWFHSTIHDGGWLYRFDATLFFRASSVGAIGPLVRYLDLSRNGGRSGEWVFGLAAGTRPGFIRAKNPDVFLVQLMIRPGDPNFGIHLLRSPVFVLLAYRMTFEFLAIAGDAGVGASHRCDSSRLGSTLRSKMRTRRSSRSSKKRATAAMTRRGQRASWYSIFSPWGSKIWGGWGSVRPLVASAMRASTARSGSQRLNSGG
jgi:hypothetical protein